VKRFLIWYFWLLVFAVAAVGAYREVEHAPEWRQWALVGFWTFIAAAIATMATGRNS
jgi:hypothetical protein